MSGLMAAYRQTGADPPFGDPARNHGAAMEGYYWRLVHPQAGWVIVWLCGVCQGPGGSWATVALAAPPWRLPAPCDGRAGRWRLRALRRPSGRCVRGFAPRVARTDRRRRVGGGTVAPSGPMAAASSRRARAGPGRSGTCAVLASRAARGRDRGRGVRRGKAPSAGGWSRLCGEELGSWVRRALVVGAGRRLLGYRRRRGLRRWAAANARCECRPNSRRSSAGRAGAALRSSASPS